MHDMLIHHPEPSPHLQLTIEKLIYGGDGLTRLPADASGKGKAAFLPFVLTGEEVEATLTEQHPGFARGRLSQVIHPSAERVPAPCPHFGTCGGCHYQHATYVEQLRIKTEILRENVRRLAKMELPAEIQVHPSQPWNYRNRTRLALRQSLDGVADASGFKLGYRRMAAEEILPVEECPIVSPLLQKAITALWKLGRAGEIPPALQEVELFANAEDAKLLVSFYGPARSAGSDAALGSLAAHLQVELPEMETAAVFGERRYKGQAAEGEKPRILLGSGSLTYKVHGRTYEVSAGAFFQSNRFLIPTLVEIVTQGRKGAAALDLYAGAGLFSLPLAAQFERVVAVESSPASFGDLRRNLPTHAKAVRSTAEAYLQEAGKKFRPELIVVDPPRTGLGTKAARRLAECHAPHITYVSCDPATLARDLAILSDEGYRVEQAHLVDLFPQTYHLETVLQLAIQ